VVICLADELGGTWSFDFYSDVKNTVYAGQGWRRDE
jgi:hypothetical protein